MGKDPEKNCFYDPNQILESFKMMHKMAESGRSNRIGMNRDPDDKYIDIIGCFHRKCNKVSKKCKLTENNVAVLARSRRKKEICAVAVQLEAEDDNIAFDKKEKVIYITPQVGHDSGIGIFETLMKNIDNRNRNITTLVYSLRDETINQEKIRSLGSNWKLKENNTASFFPLTD